MNYKLELSVKITPSSPALLLPGGLITAKGNKLGKQELPELREAPLAHNRALASASKSHSKVTPHILKVTAMSNC